MALDGNPRTYFSRLPFASWKVLQDLYTDLSNFFIQLDILSSASKEDIACLLDLRLVRTLSNHLFFNVLICLGHLKHTLLKVIIGSDLVVDGFALAFQCEVRSLFLSDGSEGIVTFEFLQFR